MAASLAGAPASSNAAARRKSREETDKSERTRRGTDEFKSVIERVEQTDAVRKLADADAEDAAEDRAEHHIGYDPDGPRRHPGGDRPSLDLNA